MKRDYAGDPGIVEIYVVGRMAGTPCLMRRLGAIGGVRACLYRHRHPGASR